MDDLLAIGEFSKCSGLSPKRLRSYAAAGLLVPAAVDTASGYRYYSPQQLRDAQLIDALREAGMPLAEIGALLRDPSCERLDVWDAQLDNDAAHRRSALDVARRLLANEDARLPTVANARLEQGSMTRLSAASRTEQGRERDNNEDAVLSGECLAVVADGVGGHSGGEIASAMAVSLVEAVYTGRSLDELQAAVRAANRAIWLRSDTDPEFDSLLTTICAAGVTEDGRLAVVHVGDSRVYLWHDGELRQLTRDHTLTADLVQRGEMTEQEALEHPYRGVLTRALGIGPHVDLDSDTHPVSVGDRLLLCSDGLCNEVPNDDITSALMPTEDLQTTADGLVDLAMSRGARDDVSVVVAEVCV